jgi:fructose-bisphosphate aldolase class I
MSAQQLEETAQAMVTGGKGLLAADESTGTIEKRLAGINVESTKANRIAYRELLFATAGSGEFISGAILYDETLRQSGSDGRRLVEILNAEGIIAGIKVDTGAKPFAGHPEETITEGLDGLRDRLSEYAELGARFTKWRGVIRIGDGIPSDACLSANAHALARYASLAQEAGLVPIVEPEVLMDGDHTIEHCQAVTENALAAVFGELFAFGVQLESIVLKPNMVVSGSECKSQASVEQVAEMTVATMRRMVPPAVPGIAFLSGGQNEEVATAHLNAMNALGDYPWQLTFSYGRALQQSALKAWGGKAENVGAAQSAYLHRARMNSLACSGDYADTLEKELAA